MSIEDLTTYTEVDSASDITITSPKAAFDTMAQEADSYVYKDFGEAFFGNFDIQFEAEITFSEFLGGGDAGQAILCAISNTIGNFPDWDTANDGIMIDTYNGGSNLTTRLRDFNNDNSDIYDWPSTTFGLRYFRFERIGTTATLKIYSDAAKQTLVDTLTITCETGSKRYLYVIASRNNVGNVAEITGYTQQFETEPIKISVSDNIAFTEFHEEGLQFTGEVGTFIENFVIDENISVQLFEAWLTTSNSEQIVLTENISAGLLQNVNFTEQIGIEEFTKAALDIPTNWIALANAGLTIERYYLTLTGDADGETDIEIPVESFQARKRTGEATYLSCVVSDWQNYSALIADRPNGEIYIEMNYEYNGESSIRQEIIRAELGDIRTYEGPLNRSIILTGHKTITFANRSVTIENPIYRALVEGRRTFRFAKVDPYLNPGDTLVVGAESMTVDYIVYTVSTVQKAMEVRET